MAVSYILKLILPVKTKNKKKIAYPPNPLSTLHPLYKVHLWEPPCSVWYKAMLLKI